MSNIRFPCHGLARRILAAVFLTLGTASAADAQHFWHRPKPYSGYHPPLVYPSGVYPGYAGSAYYLSPKKVGIPFPDYHWADPTLFSTGPSAPEIHLGSNTTAFTGETSAPVLPSPVSPVVVPLAGEVVVVGPERRLRIAEVLPGPAQSAGVMAGEVLLRVEGQRLRSVDELHAILAREDRTLTMTFLTAAGEERTRAVAIRDHRLGVRLVEEALATTSTK